MGRKWRMKIFITVKLAGKARFIFLTAKSAPQLMELSPQTYNKQMVAKTRKFALTVAI